MISDKFTIEDIHQIRRERYERQKNMTLAERIADTEKGAAAVEKRIAELKAQKEAEKQVKV